MASIGGPNVVKGGLVLSLDAANPLSYPGTGTTWNDLSGNDTNGVLTNGPTFNNTELGTIVFDGVNDFILMPNSIGSYLTTDLTFSIIAKRNGNSSSSIGGLIGNLWHTEFTGLSMYLRNNNTQITIQTADGTARTSYVLTNPVSNLNWTHYTLTVNSGIVSVYINSVLLDSRLRNIVQNPTRPVVLGKWAQSFNSYYLNGEISLASVYNKALTSNEVLQNYNATKSRFNL
jgi:hypothetical protein